MKTYKELFLKINTILGLVFVVGCGGGIEVEEEFQSHYDHFIAEAKRIAPDKELEFRSIKIKFGPVTPAEGYTEEETLGGCEIRAIRDDGSIYWGNTILINSVVWEKLSETQREVVIFHELGHCLLGRTHEDGLIVKYRTRVFKSIMNKNIIHESTYSKYKDYYMSELFLKN